MRIQNFFLIGFGKLLFFLIKTFSLGSGSTWPGHIILQVSKNFVSNILALNPNLKKVLIVGTNGKTTTTTLLKFILEENSIKSFQNEEGANLLNGVASTLIKNSTLWGNLKYDAALIEVDENALPRVSQQVKPDVVVLLNLFRDQLDRYGEVNAIARKWRESLKKLPSKSTIYLNADDPQISYIGQNLTAIVVKFGLQDKYLIKKEIPHDVDSVYCPKCGNKLSYSGISYSHLGNYKCLNCDFKRGEAVLLDQINIKLDGVYNLYNSFVMKLVATQIFSIPERDIDKVLPKFKPPFGRQEAITYKGKKVYLILSKNPTGFNQSIEVISKKLKKNRDNLLVILNDRVPDGHDISWIWDVDFERLQDAKKIFVTGDRAYDMALRFKYSDYKNLEVSNEFRNSLEDAVSKTGKDSTLYVMPTYSAMLEVRETLSGKKLL